MSEYVDVLSPANQEGTEATVQRWLKKVGDAVREHEPLLELETDKVTVEVASPAAGILAEILKPESESVEPGVALGKIRVGASAAATPSQSLAAGATSGAAASTTSSSAATKPTAAPDMRLSPAVRKLLAEHGIDASQITGTGQGGRITAEDVTNFVAARGGSQISADATGSKAVTGKKIPHSPIRKRIAQHMAASMAAAPHVTTVFEVDLGAVLKHREQHAAAFENQGAKLTLTAYFIAAAVRGLRAVPEVNSTFHADFLELHEDFNIGVGTALGNEGLIVPVIHQAQRLDLLGIAKKLGELVSTVRENKLAPEAVRGGTFTISNHGVSGSLVATPIVINQPQVAIMGVGKLEKRAVVRQVDGEDRIEIRPMCYVTLTIDHRALDAFQANAFLTAVVKELES